MSQPILTLSRALVFASEAHRNQRRKGAAQEPYVNHLIEVMNLVAEATDGADTDLLVAALLHDAIEDCGYSVAQLTEAFGPRAARIVAENSDDMSLPKDERRTRRIEGMAHKPADSRTVKIADVISNLRAVANSAPAGWTAERKLGYLEGCRQLVRAGAGANAWLEQQFEETADAVEAQIRSMTSGNLEAGHETQRHLDNAIGQAVHLVYLANTSNVEISQDDVAKFASLAADQFPSVTLQHAHAIYDGVFRPVLIARIRSDNSDEVVSMAQRLCLEFDQRFVGIEVGGRYIRVYSDDTG